MERGGDGSFGAGSFPFGDTCILYIEQENGLFWGCERSMLLPTLFLMRISRCTHRASLLDQGYCVGVTRASFSYYF